jgi:hypothetical protein
MFSLTTNFQLQMLKQWLCIAPAENRSHLREQQPKPVEPFAPELNLRASSCQPKPGRAVRPGAQAKRAKEEWPAATM